MKIENAEKLNYKDLIKTQFKGNRKQEDINKKVIAWDYKIISFRLGNETYGIDIIDVKEIKKVMKSKFTRVPNTLDFVIGVLNLRGEIITIIDLARLFHLEKPAEEIQEINPDTPINMDEEKSIIVVKVEDILLGLVVEEIRRVIPLKKSDIQPPSPLLGSINEKYIKGVAEVNEKLYVIFDVNAIFSSKAKAKKEVFSMESEISEDFFIHFCNQVEEHVGVFINEYNKFFIKELYKEYISENNITSMPTVNKESSENIINKFYSKHNDQFWDKPYISGFKDAVFPELEKICSDEIRVFDAGCGTGFEAFSVYILLKEHFGNYDIKIVAADSNLSKISNASGLEVSVNEIPSWIKMDKYFMKIQGNMNKINKEINDRIYFEFHDIKNMNTVYKEFDLIIARDLSLSLPENLYKTFLSTACSKLSHNGILVIGDNEQISRTDEFTRVANNKNISIYRKN